ncbi:latrophilin-like protein LAT-2 [Gigantopelta aegis]|uniref:latrophilin-like protein LAT-2 n=1 Tax=Gigantopelta aegis TaxID=1735272 RepID=UPI001B88C13C|nr:latrophilin-like protein LAT-2 [Gigantopelta aegis]
MSHKQYLTTSDVITINKIVDTSIVILTSNIGDTSVTNPFLVSIGCGFIAALLHYFFLAAFCWMLCEGIMLFLQLVIVFSSISKRCRRAVIWAFLGPALLIILINIVLLMLAIPAMVRYYKRRQKHSRIKDKKKRRYYQVLKHC